MAIHIAQCNSTQFSLQCVCSENAPSDSVSHYRESRRWMDQNEGERPNCSERVRSVRADDKQEERDAVIYRGGGEESRALTFMNLMSRFCFALVSVLFRHFNHLAGSVPALVCQSIKANASREGGGTINILRKQLSPTDRAALVTSETGERQTQSEKLQTREHLFHI